MLRTAVIFESSPFDRKGLFNAVHNRIKHILDTEELTIDAYCIHSRDTAFTRRVRHTPVVPDVENVNIDECRYRILWYDFSILDHIIVNKLHRRPFFFSRFMERNIGLLEGYDCIIAHSFTGALFAMEASRRYGTPFYVTWHGSDIHTHPWRNPLIMRDTARIMEKAACNFFVSRALLEYSGKITSDAVKEVLYNGVSDAFVRYSDAVRNDLRQKFGVLPQDKVVAFAGSIVAVKNVAALQPIFHSIRATYKGSLKFWIIGDGKLHSVVQKSIKADQSINVRFWGNVDPEDMPSMLNCVDVLILPSINEGLGMVGAEAMKCGASVAGSDVGGIPEVIGRDRVIPLGDGFVEGMASLVVSLLENPSHREISPELDWAATAAKELSCIRKHLKSE
ncbi:MAG: glycosyltransferase family 4 protein [Bacteroidales bacterium]|nr:glycosyltransferase family 4 protein [Bacteroidales bacterium]